MHLVGCYALYGSCTTETTFLEVVCTNVGGRNLFWFNDLIGIGCLVPVQVGYINVYLSVYFSLKNQS